MALSNDDLLQLWSTRISRGHRYREEQTAKHWDTLIAFLLGNQWDESSPEYQQVKYHAVNNFCWHILRTYLPALYFQDPHALVRIDPHTDADLKGMDDWEQFLTGRANQMIRKMGMRRESRKALMNAEIYPYGCFKVGFTSLDPETDEAITTPDRPENMDVYLLSVSPTALIVDPQATELNKSRWVAEAQIHPFLDVKNDGRYDAAALKELEPSLWPADDPQKGGYVQSPSSENSPGSDDLSEIEGYVRIWEVMTMENGGKLYTFAETPDSNGHACKDEISMELLLREEPLPYKYLRRLPYYFFSFNEIPDVLYPPSDLELIKEHQKEANYLRSMHLDQVREQKVVHIFDRGRVDKDFESRLAAAPPGALLGVDGNPQSLFSPLSTPPVPPDVYMAESEIKASAWQAAGIDMTQGNQSTKGETATAVGSRSQASSLRLQDRANTMKEMLEEVVRACLTIWLYESPAELKARQVVDEQTGQPKILEFQVEELRKNFRIVLETQNTFPINRQVEISQFLQAINLTANFPQIDKREMARRVFEMFEVKGIEKILPDSPVPRQLIELLEQSPQLLQMVEQMIQQVMAQQQGGGGAGGPVGGARMKADVNNSVPNPGNAGGASSAQGGMK